jgi:hypothetical protein
MTTNEKAVQVLDTHKTASQKHYESIVASTAKESKQIIYAAIIATQRPDSTWSLRIPACPLCKAEHVHGGGKGAKPTLGDRVTHCRVKSSVNGYTLVLIGGLK